MVCSTCSFTSPAGFRFCGSCGASLEAPAPNSAAERRLVSVLFCDLVGATQLSETLDPEDLREVIQAYQHACTAVVERHRGHIAQYLGDGILVYFGYPKAQEDDAQRAVRTGLGILRAVEQLAERFVSELSVNLAVRIGIHMGLTVAGEIGGAARKELLAVGQTPNLAARVQAEALPNSVFVSEHVQSLVHGYFETDFVGARTLKGISEPVGLYRVLSERGDADRFSVSVAEGLLPLVGRELELTQLVELAHEAFSGSPKVVLLSGEPGMGKSRLLYELRSRLTESHHNRWWNASCSLYYEDTGLYPIVGLLEHVFMFTETTSSADKFEKITRLTEQLGLDPSARDHLATLFEVDSPSGPEIQATTPSLRRTRTIQAIVNLALQTAKEGPLVMAVDDLQWADPSTLELIGTLLSQAANFAGAKLLLIGVSRTEFTPPWPNDLNKLELPRLAEHEVRALILSAAGGIPLDKEVEDQIVGRTDGIALFVEELTRILVNRSHTSVEGIPPTLHELLMARLDTLGANRELAQFCSVLGRDFRYALLRDATPTTLVDGAVGDMVSRNIFGQAGKLPDATLTFRQVLLRDVAYSSLLKTQRRKFHTLVAKAMERTSGGATALHPELIARHYSEAGDHAKAIGFWLAAARAEARRSNNKEAIRHATHGIEALAQADLPDKATLEVGLYSVLGAAHIATRGYAAPEVRDAYHRALCAAESVGNPPFLVLMGLWTYFVVRSELDEALSLANKLINLPSNRDNALCEVSARFALGFTHFFRGEFSLARQELERSAKVVTDRTDYATTSPTGDDHKIHSLGTLSWLLVYMGDPVGALVYGQEAVKRSRTSGHPYGRVFGESMCAHCLQMRGEYPQALEHLQRSLPFAQQYGFAYWVAIDTFLLGSVQADVVLAQRAANDAPRATIAEVTQLARPFTLMDQAFLGYTRSGARMSTTLMLSLMAEHAADCGDEQRLSDLIQQISTALAETDERAWQSEYHRLRGRLAHLRQQVDDAVAEFERAMKLADERAAVGLTLRAAKNLAHIFRERGDETSAKRTVDEVLRRLPEGARPVT